MIRETSFAAHRQIRRSIQYGTDITGMRFGRLIVIGVGSSKGTVKRWDCVCDCGGLKTVATHSLTNGKTASCGCLLAEAVRRTDNKHKRHGLRKSKEYKIWQSMRRRCNDTTNADYGGRGICVCHRWENDFLAFYKDMGPRPPGRTLDRIDSNGNYEPSNCRWATWTEQARNRRGNINLTAFGETKTISSWIVDSRCACGSALYRRIRKGISPEVAITAIFHSRKTS